MEQWQLIVHGLVQGVGFRYFIEHHGRRLGLAGYVENLFDGSVKICAEGDPALLEELLLLAQHGPSSAEVTSVDIAKNKAEGLWNDFEIQ